MAAIPKIVEETLGRDVTAALEEWLAASFNERNRDVLALGDERIAARFSDIHRRIHEDIAGVELRLEKRMSDLEVRVTEKMASLEIRLDAKMSEIERRISDLDVRVAGMSGMEARLEARFTKEIAAAKESMLRWFITIIVLNGGFTLFLSWASKHLF